MRYQVPQFIEVEDKLFGPLTARQFIYLAGAGGVGLATFSTLPFFIAALITAPVAALGLALAFYSMNGRPFLTVLEHGFRYLLGSKLYLWSAERTVRDKSGAAKIPAAAVPLVPKLSESKLRDLAWSLNIKDTRAGSEQPEE